MPKVNMYQSLHTTVIGPKGDPVEIQIRTWEMHRIAEEGIAAHWLYKEKKAGKDQHRRLAGVAAPAAWRRSRTPRTPREFLDSVRVDLFPDEVYVFTPKGDVKALPEGSTPIDFAYAVHTKVGEHCVGAKVNGKLVPLRYTLRQGDIVEIVTSPNQHPSRDWLKIVKSSRARSKINQWLKVEERARSIELGREMFEREAKKYRLNPTALLAGDDMIKKVAADLGYPTADDLLAAIGYGKASRAPAAEQAGARRPRWSTLEQRPPAGRHAAASADQGVRIRGVEDLLVRFAKCCNPLPGDPIVGLHHARPRPHRARARLPDRGQERARSRAAHRRRVGRRGAGQAPGPDRGLHRQRPARACSPRSPAPSPRATATSPRPRSRSPTTAGASTTSWSRSPTCASSRTS